MFYNGLFYQINNDDNFNDIQKRIQTRKDELLTLRSKLFQTAKTRRLIDEIENDIAGAESACVEYLELRKQRESKQAASLFTLDSKIVGTSFRISNVKKAVRYIVEDCGLDAYEGLSNKEIAEDYYDKVYKYDGFFTRNCNLVREPNNEYDKNAIKVMVADYHIGYLKKELSSKLACILDNTEYKIDAMLSIEGGSYKSYDYSDEKVSVTDAKYGFRINGLILDKTKINENIL